jgi:hypothetical protein
VTDISLSDIETELRMALQRNVWVCLLSAAVLAVAFFMLFHKRSETLTFTVVDALTEAPLTNVHAYPVQLWTELPAERLKMGLSSFRRFDVQSSNGVIAIAEVPKRSRFKFSVVFVADGYYTSTFERANGDVLFTGDASFRTGDEERIHLPKANQFRIQLKRTPVRVSPWQSATNRLGIRLGG